MARHYSAALGSLGVAFDVVGHSQAGKEDFTTHTAQDVFPGSNQPGTQKCLPSLAVLRSPKIALPWDATKAHPRQSR
jgi:hypothetical protein